MPRRPATSRRLVLLADGGALLDLNERLAGEGAGKIDFAKIPDLVVDVLADHNLTADAPLDSRILCTVGSEKAQGFLAKMEQSWTVRAFPLSFAKYDRSPDHGSDRHKFRLRFHAYIGYVLGVLAGGGNRTEELLVGILSDDPHLIPCMADARAAGIDARLVWWQSSLGEEVAYLAARNGVLTLLLPFEEAASRPIHQRDAVIQQLLQS
ncbi:MAG: hypothetical protein AB7N73_05625 [Gemmatimonadales bacterium]